MAAEQTIDRLQIEINAKAGNSADGVDKLAASIQKLKSAVGGGVDKLSGIAASLNKLDSAVSGLKGKAGTISSIVNSFSKLNDVDTSKITGKIDALKASVNSLGSMSSEVKTLVNSLGSIANSGGGGISENAAKSAAALAKSQAVIDKSALTSAKSQQGLAEIAAKNNQIAESAKFAAEAEQSLNDAIARTAAKSEIKAPLFDGALRAPVKLSGSSTWAQEAQSSLSASIDAIPSSTSKSVDSVSEIGSAAKKAASSVNEIKKSSDSANESISRFGGSARNAFRLQNFYGAYFILRQVGNVLGGFVTNITGYIENMNLFDVAMGTAAQSGEKLANSLQNVLGVDSGEAMKYMGLFQQIDTSFGVTNKDAVTMSENLTQLGYDLASFYNISTATSFEKLESGITGQTKALRQLGIDTSQARLQQELYSLGINKKVTDLNQADKAELRYIAIMKQTTNAQGDMARTIQTPANALRVLQAQLTIAGRAIGSIFIPALEMILPVAIAVVKVVGEMASSFASLIGFELPKIDYSSLNDIASEADDAAAGVGAIGDNAKDAKKQMDNLIGGFDELNVINKNSDSSSAVNAGAGSALGNITLPDYDMLLGGVSTQIDEIKEKVEQYIPLLTEIFKLAVSIGAAWLTWKITNGFFDGLTSLFPTLKNFSGVFLEIEAGLAVVAGLFAFAYTHSEDFRRGIGLLGEMFSAVGKTIDDFAKSINFDGERMTTTAAALVGFVGVCAIALGAPVFGTILVVGAAVVLAIQGIGYAASDSIEPVNLFGDGISSATEKKVKPFIKSMDDLSQTIKTIKWSGKIITDSDVENVKAQVKKIADAIINGLDADKNEALTTLNPLKNMLSESTYNAILAASQKYYDGQKKSVTDGEAEIIAIYKKASDEHRSVSANEYSEIDKITSDMKTSGIKTLSASETESNLILQRLKDNHVSLSAQESSEIVKNSVKSRDETIANAQKQYDGISTLAQQMYDVGAINKNQYDEMISSAGKCKDETIKSATEQHTKIVDEAKAQAGELSNQVDWSTGDIKSKWTMFWDDIGEKSGEGWSNLKNGAQGWWDYAKAGTSNWWTNDIAPWFTSEKWQALGENMKQGISGKWNEFTAWWNSLGPVKWWGENVTPWFTAKKWTDMMSGVGTAFKDTFKNAVNSGISIFNEFISWVNSRMKFSWDDIKVAGKTIVQGSSVQLFTIPKIPQLAAGNVAYKPMIAEFGEYSNASSNPEITAPQSVIYDTVVDANEGVVTALVRLIEIAQQILEKDTTIKVGEEVLAKTVNKVNASKGYNLGTQP